MSPSPVFTDLLAKYNLPRTDVIAISHTLAEPLRTTLFRGQDAHYRWFVHLPITVTPSPLFAAHPSVSYRAAPSHEMVIFQLDALRGDLFGVYTALRPLDQNALLGPTANDLRPLEVLLTGGSIRLYASEWEVVTDEVASAFVNHPDYWVEIALQRRS